MSRHRTTQTIPHGDRTGGQDAGGLPAGDARAAYRFTHGDCDITVVSDGHIHVPADIVTAGAAPEQRADMLRRLPMAPEGVTAWANIPVVNTGSELVIFDIGGGSRYQPTEGRLQRNLAACGIAPAAISRVVFTHAHPDHIWATLRDDGGLAFPNASYHVGQSEWDFWMDPDFFTSMPAALHEFAAGTQRDLRAVESRLTFLQPGDDVVPGIRALGTPGHTPGHLSFEIAGGDGLIIVADAATSPIVSFEHPDWVFGFDTLPDLAIDTRRKLLDRAAKDRPRLLGYHWTFPGLGHAERRGAAYRFVPDA
jgi:glyoxylase-like metal-dependent hydrolase (beta-lactamase superfamily II)